MSYILEALKRAERERSLGKAPAATDVARMPHMAAPEQDRSRWLIRILIVLLIVAIAVIVALGRAVSRNDREALPVSSAAPSRNAGTVPPVVARPAVTDTSTAISSLDDVAPVSKRAGEAAADYRVQPREPAQPSAVEAPAEPLRAATLPATDVDEAQSADPGLPVTPVQAPREPAVEAAAPSRALPPPLREMPDTFRAQFPALAVAVHAYDADPKHRFAIIDNHSYHEGDTLPQGPRIAAIVPEGIVFDWNGQRVLYAIQQ